MAGKRRDRQMRTRIEQERERLIAQLRDIGLTPVTGSAGASGDADQPRDEGDHAQASERRDLGFMTRERLAERINRLTVALERFEAGTYGECEVCGGAIEPARLNAIPDATRCLQCQERAEREREPAA
jgi:DnaK suppressor protein